MSRSPIAQRIAAWLIRVSCRRLPEELGAERYQEWSAELHAILDDRSVRPVLVRAVRALRYAAGISRATRHLPPPLGRPGNAPAPAWRDGAMRARRSNMATRTTVGVIIWLVVVFVVVALVRAFPNDHVWPLVLILLAAGGFAAFCLADIARADEVRYLPKWAWALICVIQIPSGGIVYLSLGRVRKARPTPHEPAHTP